MSRLQPRPGRHVPQVNLFSPPPRGLSLPLPGRFAEVALIALVIAVWAAVGVGIAMLFGWHPYAGVGP